MFPPKWMMHRCYRASVAKTASRWISVSLSSIKWGKLLGDMAQCIDFHTWISRKTPAIMPSA
jgi:hypothetical protein